MIPSTNSEDKKFARKMGNTLISISLATLLVGTASYIIDYPENFYRQIRKAKEVLFSKRLPDKLPEKHEKKLTAHLHRDITRDGKVDYIFDNGLAFMSTSNGLYALGRVTTNSLKNKIIQGDNGYWTLRGEYFPDKPAEVRGK